MLDGHCEVEPYENLVEKEGLKVERNGTQNGQQEAMFMKLKIAKFILFKRYKHITL